MKSLIIAWKDFLIKMKDFRGFLLMLVMPIILTAILGLALQPVFGSGDVALETTVGVYVADEDELSHDLENNVLRKIDSFTVKSADSEAELKIMLDDGKIDVGVALPEQWGNKLQKGSLEQVTLLIDSEKQLQTSAVKSIITAYTEKVQTISDAVNTVTPDLFISKAVSTKSIHPEEFSALVTDQLVKAQQQQFLISDGAVGEKTVSAMQYYAAAMGVMFLLFNVMTGSKSMIQERQTDTLSRLKISPTNSSTIMIGKFLAILYFAFTQFLLFYVATSFLFKVEWGGNLVQIFTVGLAYSVSVSGLAIFIASFINDMKTAVLIGGWGVQFLAILGGSMLPVYLFPNLMKQIAALTPNNWALVSFLDIMSGVSWSELALPIEVLLFIGIATLSIGICRFRGINK